MLDLLLQSIHVRIIRHVSRFQEMSVHIVFLVALVGLADMATKSPRPPNADGITPIPFDKINPRANGQFACMRIAEKAMSGGQ